MSDCLGDYLKAIGRIPLLREEEELELGRMIRQWRDNNNLPRAKQQGGRRAFERMVNGNLRLVVSIVKQYKCRIQGNATDMMDLIQAGNLGLIRAVEKYDPARGYRFSTYGYWWIRQSVSRFIQDHSHAIRVPHSLMMQASKAARQKELKSCCQDAEGLAKPDTLQHKMVERVRLLNFYNKMVSLDQCFSGGETGELSLKDLIPGPNENEINEDYQWIDQYLIQLSHEEVEVVMRRFYGEKRISLLDISKSMGKTKHRIQGVERRALKKLRTVIEPAVNPK